MIRFPFLFLSTLFLIAVPVSLAVEVSSKGTAVLSPAQEAAWWAGLSIQQKQRLTKLFYAPWFGLLREEEKIAYTYVAQSLYDFLESGVDSNLDDSYIGFAPILLRTSFHSSGTYHRGSGTGGSNGGTLLNKAELADDANGCVATATDQLNGLLRGSATVSLADAIVIAGVVALDSMDFPRMDLVEVQGGRVDLDNVSFRERLASPDNDPMNHFVTMYNLSVSELVAVIGGAHNFGAAHGECSGYIGQWTSSPLSWSNPNTGVPEFFVDLLREDWRWYEVCTFENKTASYSSIDDPFANELPDVEEDIIPEKTCAVQQSIDPKVCEEQAMRGCDFADGLYSVSESPCDVSMLQIRLRSDFFLKANPAMRQHVETFAADANLLAKEFGVAYRKLMHNGLDRCGLSGHGCGESTTCIDDIDAATGRYLSSSCVIMQEVDDEDEYGSWYLDRGASIAVLALLCVTSVLSIVLVFKQLRTGTKTATNPVAGAVEDSEGMRDVTKEFN